MILHQKIRCLDNKIYERLKIKCIDNRVDKELKNNRIKLYFNLIFIKLRSRVKIMSLVKITYVL